MFNVLVIAYYFPPMGLSGVQRTLKFVKYMPDFNWQPTVITTGKTTYFAYDENMLKELKDKNIEIIRTEAFDPNTVLSIIGSKKAPRESIRRVLNHISQTIFIPDNKKSWAKKALKEADKLISERKFDAVFVTAPPFSAFSEIAKLKEKHNIPIVFDYRDLWYESYFAYYLTHAHKFIHYKLEYAALKAADKVTVTNRKIKEKLLKDYPFLKHDDVIIVRHGYDKADFEGLTPIKKENEKLLITHSGNFIEYTTPEFILKALRQLVVENPEIASDIEFHFVGIMDPIFIKLIKRLGLQTIVKVYGYVEHSEAVRKIISSDVLWFMISERKNINAILPGKVFEYVGARKPIFANLPEGAAKIVLDEYGASYTTVPDDVNEIKEKIVEIYKDYKNNKLPVPDEEYVIKHERKRLTEELTKVFQFIMPDKE
jgi:glycosyltransferase involved in cell wall biosynthesis